MTDEVVDVDDATFLRRLAVRVERVSNERITGDLDRWYADRLREIADKMEDKNPLDTCVGCKRQIGHEEEWGTGTDKQTYHYRCLPAKKQD